MTVLMKNTIRRARGTFLRQILRFTSRSASLSGSCAVVIAPHPDDETFGCGGMIALRRNMGSRVVIIFLSRGEASHRSCCDTAVGKISTKRREHATDAMSVLGVDATNLYWLGLPDAYIPTRNDSQFADAVSALSELLVEIKPQIIYVTHPLDGWPDHTGATEITLAAIEHQNIGCSVHYYCIWMWHNLQFRSFHKVIGMSSYKVDVGDVLRSKKEAISRYFSETVSGCGVPYCGKYPKGFAENFVVPYEIYFPQE